MRSIFSLALAVGVLVLVGCFSAATAQAAERYVLRNIRVLDVETGQLGTPSDMLIDAGRIIAITPRGTLPPHATERDGRGRVVMPGLIDMHVHVFDEADFAASLRHGVTTVRNLGGFPVHPHWSAQIESGEILAPRLISTGAILNTSFGRNANPLQTFVDTPDAARRAVRQQYENGFRHVKVYSNLTAPIFAAILAQAEALGMSVSGHPVEGSDAEPVDISATLAANMATIEHVESIVWHALNDDRDPEGARALAARFAEAGATVSPTLVVHENLARIVETEGAHITRPDMAGFNPVVMGFETQSWNFWAQYTHDDRSVMQAFYVEMTGYLHEAGVRLVVGTDAGVMVTPHGSSVARELELLVDAGLSPAEALRAATLNPAAVLAMRDEIGVVREGARADLLLLSSNPLEDVGHVRDIVAVIRDGQWLGEAELAALDDAALAPNTWRTRWRLMRHVASR